VANVGFQLTRSTWLDEIRGLELESRCGASSRQGLVADWELSFVPPCCSTEDFASFDFAGLDQI
jgi:hypothetical protein